MLALSGAHRVGKSTLAKAFAEKQDWTFIQTSASPVFKHFGLHIDQQLTFDQRMLVQNAVLELHLDDARKASSKSITDRSTIDMAAYALAEWGKNAQGKQCDLLDDYVDRCLNAAKWTYSGWVMVQPGISYVEEEGKPAASKPFQYLHHTLCMGMMNDGRIKGMPRFIISSNVTEIDARITILEKIVTALPKCHLGEEVPTLH